MILGADKFRFESLAAAIEERRALVAGLLCLLWMVPGLLGREPWKPEEAYIFGVVYELVASGNWLVPGLAGEPFLRHPPFYHWTAAMTGWLLSPVLPLHDAVRVVNLLYGGCTFALLALAAKRWFGGDRAHIAPLALLGCVGLLQPAHLLVPDNAVLTAFALALFGLATARDRPVAAGLALGTGIGLAFMSRGIVSALPLAATCVVLPAVAPGFREPWFRRTLAVSVPAALPWLLVWPLVFLLREPALFREWWWIHQASRFWSDLPGTGHGPAAYYLAVLPWFSWPVFPFALWAIWHFRKDIRTASWLAAPVVLLVLALVVYSLSHDKREMFALPMLAPMALLATAVTRELRRGAVNAFFWFGIAFFLFLAAVVWFYFVAVEFGVPAPAARNMARMEPGYVPSVGPLAIAAALLLTLAWGLGLFNVRRSQERPFLTWALGTACFWAILMLLMVSWLDNAKSYRRMIGSLVAAMPARSGCISSLSLGESQRALLHYYAGIKTLRVESGHRATDCDLLIEEGTRNFTGVGRPWRRLWEGHRAGDDRERYRLYVLDPAADEGPGAPREIQD